MKSDKAIKISSEIYQSIKRIKKLTRKPIKYIVEEAIELLEKKK